MNLTIQIIVNIIFWVFLINVYSSAQIHASACVQGAVPAVPVVVVLYAYINVNVELLSHKLCALLN
jgi:hypothetical protein